MTHTTLTREQIAQDRAYWTGELAGSVSESHSAFCNRMLAMCDAATAHLTVPETDKPTLSREQVQAIIKRREQFAERDLFPEIIALCNMALSSLDMVPRLERLEALFVRVEGEAKAGHAYSMSGEDPKFPPAEAIKFSSILLIAGERLSSLPIPKGETL